MLDNQIKTQLQQYLTMLEGDLVLKVSVGDDKTSGDMLELVEEIEKMSPRITVQHAVLDRTPSFSVNKAGEESGVVFAGLPLGHEFTSLVLALLQVSGRAPKVDAAVVKRIQAIKKTMKFETYVSLTCHNCPDVVQALNIMSVLNPNISNTMIEGGAFQEEIQARDIMAVPTVFLNGENFGGGRMELEDILTKLGEVSDGSEFENVEPFDVLVVGGGPAGSAAAIYSARKGIRTGIVAERFGGQVNDTLSIENIIGTKATEGPAFVSSLEAHVLDYNVDIMKSQRVAKIEKKDFVEVTLENGAVLKGKTVILSTGARYRQLGAPGEEQFKNKGVAYCPHCDGPIFKGKDVAVIGGGNSGVEAAIDLAGIVNHVTLIQRSEELKADKVLQERVRSLKNVTVITNALTQEITGTDKVNGLTYTDRVSGEEKHVALEGVFIQIGLLPNTEFLQGALEMNERHEIVIDKHGATSMPGVFAAGDCTDTVYKQIVISMGSGATAALGAFDYMIRNVQNRELVEA
ncbi:alkyl hydroperoxide reductase subunit F [Lysinibacillus sp. 2017]|uniref:alkyl hydroperoxide reductase subunit F n=1 Tax=unclassified Lysinibacillus TaxID=2636778 RepID=UPI000D525E73|nr:MULTISPECIES: alkyl hydroperoxide reductase subunit F [unclassified Lysinibacillus]AWE08998.1 alkyl hydroperoxide reductase subunit F [Lysinibacillus sp. 2017]TGN35493.1 alkyl hydroperoxide reductase subunit F [Lysinibacillus sp. S2017]